MFHDLVAPGSTCLMGALIKHSRTKCVFSDANRKCYNIVGLDSLAVYKFLVLTDLCSRRNIRCLPICLV